MTKERPPRPPLFERLKKGLEEVEEWAKGERELKTTYVSSNGSQTIFYDPQADTVYIKVGESSVHKTEQVSSGVRVDYDAGGGIVGFKLLDASTQLASLPFAKREEKTAA
jgi:uncharacterized protein YuzE